MTIRVLSYQDVLRLLPPDACAAAMREALVALADGRVHQPDRRPVLDPPGAAGLLGLMPAYLAADKRGDGGDALDGGAGDGAGAGYGLKAVTLFPGNTARGLDSHQGAVLLFDGGTGEALAVLNASAVTEVRSAAVTAVATDLLAREDARVLAVLGTGVQGRAHVRALAHVRDFDRIKVAARDHAKTGRICAELAAELGRPVEACRSAREAVLGADVVVTATDAAEPVLRRGWLAPGCHVNAVGSAVATTREIDGETMAACTVFCDSVAAVRAEAGDFVLALREGAVGAGQLHASLADVLNGTVAGRTRPDQLTLFESVGLAAWDLVAARHALTRAERLDVGSVVPY